MEAIAIEMMGMSALAGRFAAQQLSAAWRRATHCNGQFAAGRLSSAAHRLFAARGVAFAVWHWEQAGRLLHFRPSSGS